MTQANREAPRRFPRPRIARTGILAAIILASCEAPGEFEGGTGFIYQIDLSEVRPSEEAAVIASLQRVIDERLKAFGIRKRRLRVEGRDRLRIEVPGDSPFADIKDLVIKQGSLAFHLVATAEERPADLDRSEEEERMYHEAVKERIRRQREKSGARAQDLPAGEPEPPMPRAPEIIVRAPAGPEGQPEKIALLNRETARLEGRHLESARSTKDETGRPALAFTLDPTGAIQFGELTGNNIGHRLAVVLDDRILQTAVIQSRIAANGQITGNFSHQEVATMVNILRGGSLPAPIQLIEEKPLAGGSP